MDIAGQLLAQSQGIDMGALARRFGLSEDQAHAAVGALLPAVLGGVKKADPDAVGALGDTIAAPAEDVGAGNAVLGQIFGSKDVSRQVAAHAAGQTGLSDTVLKAMLPVIAGLVAKQLGGGGGGGGGLGGMLGQVLGGAMGGAGAQPGSSGLGGLAGMFDRDGDGNPLDDILGMATGKR